MMNEQKKQARERMAQEKRRHGKAERAAKSVALLGQLERHPRFVAAHTVLLYYSLPDEVQTQAFVEKWHRQKCILLPVVRGERLELRPYAGKERLQTGAFRIEEPVGEAFTAYEAIDLAIVPGVSFDREGHRLGRGKGYYDRLLPLLSSYKIGICYGFQVSDRLPAEPFDCMMDEVWTEDGRLA